MHSDLENYVFYRFIKATYYISLVFFALMIFGIGFSYKPYETVDDEKSYITCLNNGPSFSFAKINIYAYSKDMPSFDEYNDGIARNNCYSNPYPNGSFAEKGFLSPEESAIQNGYIYNPKGDYYFTIKTKIIGSWTAVFEWWIYGGLIMYAFLNIIRESFIYISYGKKFTWSWLKKLTGN